MGASIITKSEYSLLATVNLAREELKITEADVSNEDLERKLQTASDTASGFCGRFFGIATYRETFRGCRALGSLVLAVPPVFSVVAVSLGGVALALDQYEIEDGELFMVSSSGHRREWCSSHVSVEYQAGYKLPGDTDAPAKAPVLPGDIQQAVLQLLAANLSQGGRGDPLLKVSEIEGIGRREYYVQGTNAKLPNPEAEATLNRYKLGGLA